MQPTELQARIRGYDALSDALNAEPFSLPAVYSAVRKFVDEYADDCMASVLDVAKDHVTKGLIADANARIGVLFTHAQDADKALRDVKDAARAVTGSGRHAERILAIEDKYKDDLDFVLAMASSLDTLEEGIMKASKLISALVMQDKAQDPSVGANQKVRDTLEKELEHAHKSIVRYFNPGFTTKDSYKEKASNMVVPKGLKKGDALTFGRQFNAWRNPRASRFGVIMHEMDRVMAMSKIGQYYVPPNKKDGFASVDSKIRTRHQAQSLHLWDELVQNMPKDIMLDIRTEFKYGPSEQIARCEEGDGLTALFCILAKYRPAGVAHRNDIKDSLGNMARAQLFKDGANPAVHIKKIQQELEEAINLDIKL